MKKVPNLRFKEFSGEWESKKIGSICEIIMGQSPSSACYNEDKIGLPLIQGNADVKNRKTFPRVYTSDITKTCDVGDIIMSVRAPVGAISKSLHHACIGRGVCSIKPKQNSEFIYQFLLNYENKWSRISQGSTFESINSSDITSTNVVLPLREEQEKIASFFSLIDKEIELQTEKVEELKNYKKGLLQKIFSQELRFKDENGNEYPEWEEKTLQQIGFTYAGLSGKTKEDFGFGNGSFVTYINVFRNTLAKRMIEQVNISEQENQNPVLKGDLLFTTSSETPNEVGMVSCWDYEIKNLYLNSFCFGYRIYNHNSYSPIFLAYMLRSGEYRKKISILAQGSTRYNISKTELMKMKVQCPCMEEQQKIVALLLNLELKTEEEQNKLNELLQYKKGLLQQMFI